MKKCSKCKKIKQVKDFNFKIKADEIRHSQCRECTKTLVRQHYNRNREYYLLKARKRNREIKTEVISYLNKYLLKHPCVDCGESDLAVLEFNHVGEKPKLKAVSSLVRLGFTLNKIKEEIDKCEVRCANCHRRKTARDFNWLKVKKPL